MTARAPMVSYAQNFEDVVLWRALGHVSNGTYIDVGAAWPRIDSVTCWFYEQGWSGVNVEPNPAFHAELEAERGRDINLRVAVAPAPAVVTFNVVNDTGLSTLRPELAAEHSAAARIVEQIDTSTLPLSAIWADHLGEHHQVHFLKVDVEGFEGEVIASNDWDRFRPWILVVEAVHPLTFHPTHEEWEPVLLEAGYIRVYFDGINLFYVAVEHSDLADAFNRPPGILDGFVPARQLQAEDRVWRMQVERRFALRVDDTLLTRWQEILAAPADVRQQQQAFMLAEALAVTADIDVAGVRRSREENDCLREALASTEHQLDAVLRSRAYRLTWPLRIAHRCISSPGGALRFVARHTIGPIVWRLMSKPRLGRLIVLTLGPVPWIGPRLRRHAEAVAAQVVFDAAADSTEATRSYVAILPEAAVDG